MISIYMNVPFFSMPRDKALYLWTNTNKNVVLVAARRVLCNFLYRRLFKAPPATCEKYVKSITLEA